MAIQDDDELARRQQDAARRAGQPAKKSSKSKVDAHTWTPERAALTDVADILMAIRASLEAKRTGKRQKVTPMPRPRLARDRLAQADTYDRHRERVALMLPGRG